PFVSNVPLRHQIQGPTKTIDSQQNFSGGCLKFFTENWAQLGANQFILKSIANYHLPFRKKPPLKFPTQKFLECLSTKVSPEMTEMVKDLKCKRILEKPVASGPGYFSKMFLIKKPDGGLRPIFDLKALNTFVETFLPNIAEVRNHTYAQAGILGTGLGYTQPDNSIADQESNTYKKLSNKYIESKQLLIERTSDFTRHAKFCQPCNPLRPASLSQGTGLTKKVQSKNTEKTTLLQSTAGFTMLVKISEARRSLDRQVRSLFVSITGVLRPASKTMIAGWVRSAFKLAKIDASPGSIRSAVASRRWLDNRPVQEILDRGNWKCLETFSKDK
ncbi:hypothetical protein HF086_004964, partial [Spodoptera exigua]